MLGECLVTFEDLLSAVGDVLVAAGTGQLAECLAQCLVLASDFEVNVALRLRPSGGAMQRLFQKSLRVHVCSFSRMDWRYCSGRLRQGNFSFPLSGQSLHSS